ncbi:hypothetical protein ACFQ67_11515 [Streptomyces sp. NPDC056488]|uniref:hypothetical protein n=1 Tax=Streptomyces sp. NPDC056488 TaxID=3345836 RepID=UPI00369469B6
MELHVMSGPHQGETWTTTHLDVELRRAHPTRPDVVCRYTMLDGDGPIAGLPDARQLHYIGDVPLLDADH